MIPVARTAICYSVCLQGSVTDVHVMNMDDVRIHGSDEDRIWSRPLMSTTGCCYTDWMTTHALTPEFVFSELLVFYGFADSSVADKAISEFAKIETCGWARAMVPSTPSAKTAPM